MYAYHPRYRGGRQKWICWLRFVDDPVSIAYARRVYDKWRGGLVALLDVFVANRNRLYAHTVAGLAAPQQPWKAQKNKADEIGLDKLLGNP